MKIEQIEGNLLGFPNGINILCQNCNCHAIQAAGIALQIKKRYPKAYSADWEFHNKNNDYLGKFSFARVGNERYIVNLYGQDKFGIGARQVNYEGIYSAMELLFQDLNQEYPKIDLKNGPIIGFPYGMGAGLAGGSWPIIYSMIEDIFAGSEEIKVYVVKFNG